MAVTKVGSSAPAGSTGAVTLPWPAGHAAGDLAIIYISGGSGSSYAAPALPSDCTNLGTVAGASDANTATGNGVGFRVCYLLATSSSMPDLTIADVGNYTLAAMTVFRGVDQTTPIFASNVAEGPTATTNQTKSAGTAPVAGLSASTLAILIFGMGDALPTESTTFGTEEVDTSIDAGTYEGTLFSAVGTLSDPDSTSYSITRGSTSSRSNFGRAWVIPNPMAVSAISGDSASVLSTSATLAGTGALAATAPATLDATGTLTGSGLLIGDTTFQLTTNGELGGFGELIGTSVSVLSASGNITGLTDSLLSANVSLQLSASGNLTAIGSMSANVGTVLTAVGTLNSEGGLVGLSESVLTASGNLSQLNELAGLATMGLTVAPATLSGSYTLGGTSASTMTATGTLTGRGALVGTSTGVLNAVGTGVPGGFLSGLSSSALTAVGSLRSVTLSSIAINFRNKWLAVYNARQALHNKISGLTKLTLESQSTAITSLQNQITHPVTGLSALSTAQTTLNSRVSLVEGDIEVLAEDITELGVSVEGKASVAVTNSLTARIDTIDSPYGINLLNNPGLAVDMRNWGTVIWNEVNDPDWIVERNLLGVGYQVAGFNNFGFRHPATPATGVSFVAGGDYVEATEALDYIASGKICSSNLAYAELRLYFYNDVLTPLGEVPSVPNSVGYVGGTSESNWVYSYVKATAPAGTKWMRLGLRGLTNGAATPRAQVMKAMVEQASIGQTVPSAWNVGRLAAWAEWNLQFDVNGHISGVSLSSDGKTSDFVINADTFGVQKPGGGAGLTWSNGHLWNKGTTYSVILGQDMTPDEDVIMWIGPNPTSPQTALKEDAAMYIMEDGSAVFRGTLNQSLITGSAFELGSTRIHTGGGRLAPFTARAAAYRGTGTRFSGAVTLSDFQSPNVGTGYHFKRFSRQKADVNLHCFFQGDGNAGDREDLHLEVQYDGGAWLTITTKAAIDTDNHGSWVFFIRYTTKEVWDTVAFRARTVGGYSMILSLAVEIDNTYETGNAPESWSGTDASTGTGGTAPPPTGGGGGGGDPGGGTFCVVADMAYLPDGTLVAANEDGTQFPCWNGEIEDPAIEWHPLRSMPFGYAPSYIVVTENGAAVPQSESTPIPLRDGRMVTTLQCLDQEVLTNIAGKLEWSRVVSLDYLGVVRVAKPDLGDRVFFAGTNPLATIATHNIRNKDLDP